MGGILNDMNSSFLDPIAQLLIAYPSVKLGYFFGSRAEGKAGPLSDYDFAFYADEPDEAKVFGLRLALMDEISQLLKTDQIDVVMLSSLDAPELEYQIIANGRLFYQQEPYRILVEPKILNRYFDYREFMRRHQLTLS